jgi:hypothetical protein
MFETFTSSVDLEFSLWISSDEKGTSKETPALEGQEGRLRPHIR